MLLVNPKIEIFTKAEAAEMLNCLQEEDLMFQTFIQLAIIGHSEIETTQKYLHYLSDADAEAANILTNMIEEDESHHINIDMAL